MYSTIHTGVISFAACVVVTLGTAGCQGDSASDLGRALPTAEVTTLEEYNTIVSYEGGILANPAVVKYDGDSLLYVYDVEKKQVLVLNENGETAHEFGGEGPQPATPRAKNITNKPFVTANGNVLLPAIGPEKDFNSLYTLADWEGKELAEIGEIPEGSAFVLDYKQYQAAGKYSHFNI